MEPDWGKVGERGRGREKDSREGSEVRREEGTLKNIENRFAGMEKGRVENRLKERVEKFPFETKEEQRLLDRIYKMDRIGNGSTQRARRERQAPPHPKNRETGGTRDKRREMGGKECGAAGVGSPETCVLGPAPPDETGRTALCQCLAIF